MRPAARRALLVGASAAAALVLVEVGLRAALGARYVAGPAPHRVEEVLGRHDPDLGWSLTPNASARISGMGLTYDVTLDAHGFRDVERGPRRAGVRRVAMLGDSYGFGWGVAREEGVAARLEADARVAAEVANLSVPGYSTDQELWTLEREADRLDPDLVLVAFCPNDLDGNETTNSHRMLKPRFFTHGGGRWLIQNRPCVKVREVATDAPYDGPFATSATWQVVSGRTPLVDPPTVPASAARGAGVDPFGRSSPTRHAFELLAALCKKRGAALAAFAVPDLGGADAQDAKPGDEIRYAATRGLASLGAELGFDVVSVDAPLRAAWESGVAVLVPDGHWNAEGHRIVAEALAPRLAEILARLPAR